MFSFRFQTVALLAVVVATLFVCGAHASKPKRVAIIGAGIGGATTAYYISQAAKRSGEQYELHMFEKQDRVGGRILSFSVTDEVVSEDHLSRADKTMNLKHPAYENTTRSEHGSRKLEKKIWFELGAAVWAAPNLLLDDLAQDLSIELYSSDENAGMDDLNVLVYEGGPAKRSYPLALADATHLETLLTAAHMERFKINLLQNYLEFLPRDYGLTHEIEEHKYRPRMNRVAIERTVPWQNIGEWSSHGDIDVFTSTTTREYLFSHGVSHNFTSHHIEPFTRVIYDQNADANAFAGFAALVSADQVRVATHGLQAMVSQIINASGAQLHLSAPISTITRTAHGHKQGNFEIVAMDGSPHYFDVVVLAAPIEYLDIKFVHLPHVLNIERREYVGKTTTYVRAKALNTDFFGVPASTNALLTNEESDVNGVGFISISPHHRFHNGDYLYKIFSKATLRLLPGSLHNWFIDGVILDSQEWEYTFPRLYPPAKYSGASAKTCQRKDTQDAPPHALQDFQPILVEKDFYYTSAMDSVAVAMESSTLAGFNVAQMIVWGHTHPSFLPDPHGTHTAADTHPRSHQHHQHHHVSSRQFMHSEILRLIRGYLAPYDTYLDQLAVFLASHPDFTRLGNYLSIADVYLLGYIVLGVIYGASPLLWLRPRFNSLFLLSILFLGHTIGYWLEVLVSDAAAHVVGEVHAHATLIGADVLAGILVASGTWLSDAILPLGMLARTVVRLDAWVGLGAIAGVALWPAISEPLLSSLSLVSRFYGGPTPSLSLLDVDLSTATNVSITLFVAGIVCAGLSKYSFKWALVLAPLLSFTHIGYLFGSKFLGSTSDWTRIIPSHVASYLYQDGFAAIVDPLSSTQMLVLILVPLFLIGAYAGNLLTRLWEPSTTVTPKQPRFSGTWRLLGGFLLVIGMAIHSGSYQFLAAYYVTISMLGLL